MRNWKLPKNVPLENFSTNRLVWLPKERDSWAVFAVKETCKRIKNQTRLTCKVKFDGNSIDLLKAEDDNNESMLAL